MSPHLVNLLSTAGIVSAALIVILLVIREFFKHVKIPPLTRKQADSFLRIVIYGAFGLAALAIIAWTVVTSLGRGG